MSLVTRSEEKEEIGAGMAGYSFQRFNDLQQIKMEWYIFQHYQNEVDSLGLALTVDAGARVLCEYFLAGL